ncbi:hypothetical protein C6988_00620 [Nitrosopumilus sp. b1]|uniref:PRC-barrel domain-containing protein n=1 Tax=Nitrosopumilus sp. b1 TaxID=2109907 RepID=UPI0015F3BDF2|nr:PRC-barrel domain-containing protein [Nitrosopumilus sp. b1]KAF6243950.1 hypothetical protein C6988_00620 [Nitrosopumilus sp. b1]
MSSDLRIKKLRGSGGYIMASVNDDQQRKGNLGGPDLFLAPIGRLDSDTISKYFCNTCEKDYEGSPRIEYENPNEEVAENLILLEKGQYICATCGSTLAEYREFRKPDEMTDVGNARPMEQSNPFESPEQTFTPPQTTTEPPSFTEPEPEPQSIPEPPMSPPAPSFSTQQSAPPAVESQPVGSVSSIVGMAVYNEEAKRIGTAKQIGIDSSQSLVLVISNNDGSDQTIPWSNIKKVGEIVLVGTSSAATQVPPTVAPQVQTSSDSGKCPSCNFVNKSGSKFCEECGTKI